MTTQLAKQHRKARAEPSSAPPAGGVSPLLCRGLKRSRTRTPSLFRSNEMQTPDRARLCLQHSRETTACLPRVRCEQCNPRRPSKEVCATTLLALLSPRWGLTPCTPRPRAPGKTGPLTPPRRAQGQLLPQPPPLPKLPGSSCWCFAFPARYEPSFFALSLLCRHTKNRRFLSGDDIDSTPGFPKIAGSSPKPGQRDKTTIASKGQRQQRTGDL